MDAGGAACDACVRRGISGYAGGPDVKERPLQLEGAFL